MLGRLRSVVTGFVVLACLATPCLWGAPAVAEEPPALKGIALVIGQSDYQSLAKLSNPKADARAMEERLAALGFQTDLALDEGTRKLKRTVSGFIEDAEGADVALVYYSGHAIEAGGINYLIPVDAGLPSLAAAEETLVPLQPMLEELRRKAKVTILLIDACRTNPFPAGVLVKGTAAAPGQPISPTGLAATKGAIALASEDQPAPDSLGEIVGYAAEPGQVALDGAAGANSPYASALLKHLAANRSYDFGQVMTLVTEEVYLATGTRQRPWTNASLRRFLTFGGKLEEASSDEALIDDARRQLLITIAATPPETRNFVEALAREQKESLDLVYGMLKELQVATTADPETIAQQLKEGVAQAKRLRAERDALRQDDPQILALTKLADRAEAEGALALAKEFWRRASLRTDELAATREQNKTDVMLRARKAASVYMRHAEAAALASDYQTAAREYGKAYKEIEWFNKRLALGFRLWEAEAFVKQGMRNRDPNAVKQALSVYAAELQTSQRDNDLFLWAARQTDIGKTLMRLDQLDRNAETLRQAVAAHEAAVAELSRDQSPVYLTYLAWAQDDLGDALKRLGEREDNAATLRKAVIAYEAALSGKYYFKNLPEFWAGTQNKLGNILQSLGEDEYDKELLRKAVTAYEAALTHRPREKSPFTWAKTQNDLGFTLLNLADQEDNTKLLHKSVTALEAALTEYTRERTPFQWAWAQVGLGYALTNLGERENKTEALRNSMIAYELALGELSRDKRLIHWAAAQNGLGYSLALLGEQTKDLALVEKAVSILKPVLEELTRGNYKLAYSTSGSLCRALVVFGTLTQERNSLMEAKGHCLYARDRKDRKLTAWEARETESLLTMIEKALSEIN